MSKQFPVKGCSKTNACGYTAHAHVTSTADALRGSHAQKCILFQKSLVLIETPVKNSLFVAVIPLDLRQLSTLNSLHYSLYVSPQPQIQRITVSLLAITPYPLPIEALGSDAL